MKTPVSRSSTGWARFFRGPWKVLMPLGLVGLSFLIMVLLVLNKKPLVEEPPRIEGIPVEVAEIRQQGQRVEVYSQGTVQPTVRTELAAEVPGRVVEVSPNFVVGGFFKKGRCCCAWTTGIFSPGSPRPRRHWLRRRVAWPRRKGALRVRTAIGWD